MLWKKKNIQLFFLQPKVKTANKKVSTVNNITTEVHIIYRYLDQIRDIFLYSFKILASYDIRTNHRYIEFLRVAPIPTVSGTIKG